MGNFYAEFVKNNTLVSVLLILLIAGITLIIKLRESRIEDKIKQGQENENKRFDEFEKRFDEFEKRFDEFEKRYDNKFDTSEKVRSEVRLLLDGLLSTTTSLLETYNSLNEKVEKISALEGKIDYIKIDQERQKDSIDELRKNIENLKEKIYTGEKNGK